jgi:hypothetical protein
MEWYYSQNNQQLGPVDRAQFDQLVKSGSITPETLVWHDGMAQWEPLSKISSPTAAVVSMPGQELCTECRKPFSKSELVQYENCWICATCKPIFFQKLKEGVTVGTTSVWRSGANIVMGHTSALPDRCVKCNTNVNEKMKRTLYWHPPLVFALVLFNLIIYAVVAVIVRKKAVIHVGLCPEHRHSRKIAIAVSWGLVLLSFAALFIGITNDWMWVALSFPIILIGALIYGSIKTRILAPKKIDKDFVWVKGACPEYLAALPEWTRPT